ncbi:MAG: response regulator [Herminiimonas sp.]|nr:response regulator [Herminiimonas sp.]
MATILVVDDHAINRAFLVTLLSYCDHRMLEAQDGAAALKMMQRERPDLVISDILMPNMDGHEFVTRMHASPDLVQIPVIFYTAAHHEEEALVIARSCGVRGVLTKPSEPDVIMRTVSEVLGVALTVKSVPPLTAPPAEGSRFSTIDNQLAEYLVELESSSALIAQLAVAPGMTEAASVDRAAAQKRLASSLLHLQSASIRLTSLLDISREIAAETDTGVEADAHVAAAPGYSIARLPSGGSTVPPPAAGNDRAEITVTRERAKFRERLAKALQFAGYPHDSPTQLAREFNFRFSGRPVTIHAARKWLVGESIPTQDKLRILAQWLGVTAEWLRFGDADKTAAGHVRPPAPAANSEEGKLLAALLELDPYHRRLAHDFVSMLAAKPMQAGAPGKQPATPRNIKVRPA